MGFSGDHSLRPVQARLNVLGWSSLALYGLAWAAWPGLGGRIARRTHPGLSATGTVLLPCGLLIELHGGPVAPLVAGSAAWAADVPISGDCGASPPPRRRRGARGPRRPGRRIDSAMNLGRTHMPILAPSILVAELRDLGVREGDLLMVHASLRAIGPVAGGGEALGDALTLAVGASGSLMAYAFWDRSPYEETLNGRRLNPTERARWPAFDPATAGVYPGFGYFNAVLRERPGALRSAHPDASMVAVGPHAGALIEPHHLGQAFGPGSPLERFVALGGRVLLLGADPDSLTVLHYAEAIADIPGKRRVSYEMPLWVRGARSSGRA